MPQSDNTNTEDTQQKMADLGDSLYMLMDVVKDSADATRELIGTMRERRTGADASGIASAGARAAFSSRAELEAWSKAVNGSRNASNHFSKSLRKAFGLQAEGSKIVRDKMYGAGKQAEIWAATAKHADKVWVDALDDFRRAADSASNLYAAFRALTGTIKLTKAALGGSGGAAVSLGAVLGGGGGGFWDLILKLAEKTFLGQMMLMYSENKDALKGGNVANAMQASMISGYHYTGDNMAVSDYAAYRTEMRMRGMREEAEIGNTLMALVHQGMFGAPRSASGSDASRAAISKQTVRTLFGMDFADDFMGRMFRSTAGNRAGSGMYDVQGLFNMSGYAAALNKISAASRSPVTGAAVGMQELNSIVEELSKSFLGTKQNINGLLQSLSNWKEALRDNKLTREDLLGLFGGTNENMSLTQKLTAFAFAGMGSGNMLEEAWKWNERARTAQGKPTNLAYAAQSALAAYRGIGGTDTSKDKMMLFSENMLDQFGLGALKNNPEMISLLKGAASGDRKSIESLEEITKTEADRMDQMSRTLDAIRNPVEHMRDYLFSKAFVNPKGLIKGRARSYEYEGMMMGYDNEDLTKYVSARQAQDNVGKLSDEELKHNLKLMTEQFKPMSETMQALISRISDFSNYTQAVGSSN